MEKAEFRRLVEEKAERQIDRLKRVAGRLSTDDEKEAKKLEYVNTIMRAVLADEAAREAFNKATPEQKRDFVNEVREIIDGIIFPESMSHTVIDVLADEDGEKERIIEKINRLISELKSKYPDELNDFLSIIESLIKNVENKSKLEKKDPSDSWILHIESNIKKLYEQLDEDTIRKIVVEKGLFDIREKISDLIFLVNDLISKTATAPELPTVEPKESELDINLAEFKKLSKDQKRHWLFRVLKLFMGSDAFYLSEKNTGYYLKSTFDQALTFLEEEGDEDEKKLVKWLEARLKLSLPANVAGVRYGLDYDSLLDGGTSLKDSTSTWEGLKVEGTTFNIHQLGFLLSKEGEIDKGDSERLELIIDVADAWFSGKRFPEGRSAMYSDKLRDDLSDKIVQIHKDANRRSPEATKEGYFLAIEKFDDNLLGDFNTALEEVWNLTYEGTDQSDEEGRLFSTAKHLITFLDIRNTRAQDQYMAASSPVDEGVQKTIKQTSLRVNPSVVVSYANIGKGVGNYFNPALALGKANPRAIEFLSKKPHYILKYRHSEQVMEAWLDWYAPIPASFVNGLEQYDFYGNDDERERYSPFPRISEYYWYDLKNRKKLIEQSAVGLESFRNYLENAKNFEKYINKCLEGADVSVSADFKDDPAHFDTELTEKIGNIVAEVANAISATKGMILDEKRGHEHGIDGYYVARAVYLFCRQLILQVAQDKEKDLNNQDYNVLLAFVSRAVWRAARAGGTMDGITFYSPEDKKTMSVMEYVTSRIPNPSIKRTPLGYSIDFKAGTRPPSDEYIRAIAYNHVRVHNNQHHLDELAERGDSYFDEIKHNIRKQLTGRDDHSHYVQSIRKIIAKYKIPITDPDYSDESMWGKTIIPHKISGKKTEEAKAVKE